MKLQKYQKSRTRGELIPSVIIYFRNWMNLIMTEVSYKEMGYRKLLKDFCVPVGEIEKVHHCLLNPKDFPDNEWEP